MNKVLRIFYICLLCTVLSLAQQILHAGNTRLEVSGDKIHLNGKETKIIGLRCSNALVSDRSTVDLIAALDLYRSYGVNTVSVFLMGSRFGDVKGYLPDSSLNPVYRDRLERILRATDVRGMVTIVGCLYWSTSRAKEDLSAWTQDDADRAIGNTARWLAERDCTNVILDPDNEGMAVRAMKWKVESLIRAAKAANPALVVANNTRQNPPNEDLNMHFGKHEEGKPWFDCEATPGNAPGKYWGRYSKQSHQADRAFYNYSRIGRYTAEMKAHQLQRTRDEIERFNGYMLASTWLQCSPAEGVNGPFTNPGGRSELGSGTDEHAAWNTDIDTIHSDAGLLWWLEFVRDTYGSGGPDTWTFVSMPDFLNVDTLYPQPGLEEALDYVLRAVAAENPEFVLIAGDLLMGRWWSEEKIEKYAALYYPAWIKRMNAHGLKFYAALGDHEIGDNPWPPARARLVPSFKKAFRDYLKMPLNGPDHMKGTAFSFVHRNTLFAAVDVFEKGKGRQGDIVAQVTGKQLEWLEETLACHQTVDHMVVMGHTPVLGPVRKQSSSGLMLEKGRESPLWQTMARHGVDLYLCGEVHAMTCTERDGVQQIAHGGLFGYNPKVSYLVVRVSPQKLELELKEIDILCTGEKLWQEGRNRPKETVTISEEVRQRGYLGVGKMIVDKSAAKKRTRDKTGYFDETNNPGK